MSGKPMMDHEDKRLISAMVRDRLGMEARVLEIDVAILDATDKINALRMEADALRREKSDLRSKIAELTNVEIGKKFERSPGAIHNSVFGRDDT